MVKSIYLFVSSVLLVLEGQRVSADSVHPFPKACCSDGFGLNYTLPMFDQCKKKLYKNGSMIQTIPKLIPHSPAEAAQCRRKSKLGIPPGRRVCRFPDCLGNPCQSGWCGETMTGYQCYAPTELPDEPTDGNINPSISVTTYKPDTVLSTEPYRQTTQTITTSDTQSTTSESATVATSVPPDLCNTVGWMQGIGKCYLFPNIAWKKWNEARQYCEDLDPVMIGGVNRYPSLLVPENDEENELLQSFTFPDKMYWINCQKEEDYVVSCKTNRVRDTTEYRS